MLLPAPGRSPMSRLYNNSSMKRKTCQRIRIMGLIPVRDPIMRITWISWLAQKACNKTI